MFCSVHSIAERGFCITNKSLVMHKNRVVFKRLIVSLFVMNDDGRFLKYDIGSDL